MAAGARGAPDLRAQSDRLSDRRAPRLILLCPLQTRTRGFVAARAVIRPAVQPPATVRPMPEPHNDRSAATRDRERRVVAPPPSRTPRAAGRPVRARRTGDPHPPPVRNAALIRDHAAPVRGHSHLHRALRRARPQQGSPRPERLARLRHAQRDGGGRLRHRERPPALIDGEVHWDCGSEQKPERGGHVPVTRGERARRGMTKRTARSSRDQACAAPRSPGINACSRAGALS